jgi:hypothetical protein
MSRRNQIFTVSKEELSDLIFVSWTELFPPSFVLTERRGPHLPQKLRNRKSSILEECPFKEFLRKTWNYPRSLPPLCLMGVE